MVSKQHIWDGYVRLHRYCQSVGVSANTRIKLPKNISAYLPPPHIDLCKRGAELLTELDKEYPNPFGEEYFAYLFLFRQLLRISFGSGPYYGGPDLGWRGLEWATLPMLIGNEQKAIKEWERFYKSHTFDKQADFYAFYPPLDAEEVFQCRVASMEVSHFFTLAARKKNSYAVVKEGEWHSWLWFAEPDFWNDYDALKDKLIYFGPLLKDRKAWRAFVYQFLPIRYEKDLKKMKTRLAYAIDNVVRGQSREARMCWSKYAGRELLK